MMYDLIVMGGGAAGFFGAVQLAERSPGSRVLILEKSPNVLGKVKISGGGRCNVTHACFDPQEMVGHYPRGQKELLGPFHRFLCGDMMGWLADHGVETKIEDDGRVFPISDRSQTIIDCFTGLCQQYGVEIQKGVTVNGLAQTPKGWKLATSKGEFFGRHVLMATGSSPAAWKMLEKMGYAIVPPVPSLFTFNIQHPLLKNLAGVSVPQAQVHILKTAFQANGPLLITHWGLSGPAVLKLSAWAARKLHGWQYCFEISVDWVGQGKEAVMGEIQRIRQQQGKKLLGNVPLFLLPKRLWQRMVALLSLQQVNFASLNTAQIEQLAVMVAECRLEVRGKSTFKEEFVTCGGVDNKQVHFKTMESKLHPGLYFAGEVLNIDAITGGFNFQAAWTGAFLAAEAISEKQNR